MTRVTLPPGLSAEHLAKITGLNVSTIYRALDQEGSPKTVKAIHWATGGAVPAWKLRPDLWSEGQIPPAPHAA